MHHSMHSSWSVQQLILLRSGWTRDAKALRQYLRLPEILNSELIRTFMRRSSIICSLVIAAIIVALNVSLTILIKRRRKAKRRQRVNDLFHVSQCMQNMLFKVSHHYTLKNSTVNTLTSLLNGNLKAIRYLQKIYLNNKP